MNASDPAPKEQPAGARHDQRARAAQEGLRGGLEGQLDRQELEKFARFADEWWNPDGKFRPLHKFNPVRLDFLVHQICARFGRKKGAADALSGLSVLDIGCGGGLVCEPLARLGGAVTGIDPVARNIEAARIHAQKSALSIDYRVAGAHELTAPPRAGEVRHGEAHRYAGPCFDVVLALEVIEHVSDIAGFARQCARLAKPGGLVFFATINRTAKAFMLAIIGAEYILRWLPRGTHQYHRLVRPEEIRAPLSDENMEQVTATGIAYNPLADKWLLTKNLDVNYMLVFQRQ